MDIKMSNKPRPRDILLKQYGNDLTNLFYQYRFGNPYTNKKKLIKLLHGMHKNKMSDQLRRMVIQYKRNPRLWMLLGAKKYLFCRLCNKLRSYYITCEIYPCRFQACSECWKGERKQTKRSSNHCSACVWQRIAGRLKPKKKLISNNI